MATRFCCQGFALAKLVLKGQIRTEQICGIHSSTVFRCKTLEVLPENVEMKTKVFRTAAVKNKETFLAIIDSFQDTKKVKRGHVEFIYAALKCMKEYNVNADIECYKKLMDIFPKARMIPKNMIQSEFTHFPRHQDCAITILDEMETNGICADAEMKELIINIFGKSSHVYKKLARQLYWLQKFLNLDPYKLPHPVPSDVQILAELALKKMSVDPRTKLTRFKAEDLEDSIDKTWIVSAQSPAQQKLLIKQNKEKPVFVEGPYLIWMSSISLFYFVLRADPVPRPKVEVNMDDVTGMSLFMFGEPKPKELLAAPSTEHELEDGTILGMCITGTSSKDSVLSWIRFLQETNPVLDSLGVLLKLQTASTALTTVNAPPPSQEQSTEEENSTKEDVRQSV